MFYKYIEEKNYQQKNKKIRKKIYKISKSMIQKQYAKKILFIVKRKKKEIKQAEDYFVFQKNNNGSHDTR